MTEMPEEPPNGPEPNGAKAWYDELPFQAIFALLALSGVLFVVVGWVAHCSGFHLYSQLAGDFSFLDGYLERDCPNIQYADVRNSLLADFVFIVVYSVSLWLALTRWWKLAWRTERLRDQVYAIRWFPVAAGALDFVENIVTLLVIKEDPKTGGLIFGEFSGLRPSLEDPGWLVAVFAWPKWLLVVVSLIGLVLVAFGSAGFRVGKRKENAPTAEKQPAVQTKVVDEDDIGICLSGGGIRAASFSLGALEAFDEERLLERTRWITSVSGGGYVATAWYIANGEREQHARCTQDDPELLARTQDELGLLSRAEDKPGLLGRTRNDPNLYKYIRRNRRYLATGRGGLPAAVLWALFGIVVNVALLATFLYLFAYPLGRFISWFAVHPGIKEAAPLHVPWRLWAPGVIPIAVALLAALASLPFWDPWRGRLVKIAGISAGLGIVLLTLLIAVPWAITSGPDAVERLGESLLGNEAKTSDSSATASGGWFLALLSGLGVTAALTRLALKPLSKNAPKLGGVLLALGVILLLGMIALDAATGTGPFSQTWPCYVLIFVVFAAAYWFLNAQLWSLNNLYDSRLRTTFATTIEADKRVAGAPHEAGVYPVRRKHELDWDEYDPEKRPELVICAAAQRKHNSVTGLPAVSFVFSASEIGMYETHFDATGKLCVVESLVPTDQYLQATKGRLRKVSAAASISGAAFSSAMGRHSMGTTNALLAAFNLSLGVWLPNPRLLKKNRPLRFKRPRLSYRIKEIIGTYDIQHDPYVYVSDGGHWENLGLVELIRRRCPTIFCVDASGDEVGSFGTLREAIQLASLECGTEVEINLDPLKPDCDTGLSQQNAVQGTICYPATDEGVPQATGKLYYIKAGVAKGSGLELRSFGVRDKTFPRYSTGNQFLREDEFNNLVQLGYEAAQAGIEIYVNPPPDEEDDSANANGN